MTQVIGSTIEILERHIRGRMPDGGNGAIIAPNVLRINGDDIWSAKDHPVEVGPINFNPLGDEPVVVPVTMTVRLADERIEAPNAAGNRHAPPAATLTICPDRIAINGKTVWVGEGGAEILWRYPGTDCARVRIPLLARRLVIDDEPGTPVASLPMGSKWGLIGDDIPAPAAAA